MFIQESGPAQPRSGKGLFVFPGFDFHLIA
jgi:hypothetical protein